MSGAARARACLGVLACLLACACACSGPPPNKALYVRHPETKCALIAFSGCAALAPTPTSRGGEAGDDDAGTAQASR